LVGLVGCTALAMGALVSTALSAAPAAAARTSIQRSAVGPAPGTIFVANAGSGDGAGGNRNGSVTAYSPGAAGNARPELVVTAGVDNPNSITFDRFGDLWVANNASSTVTEYNRAELAKASPVPTVTISVASPGGDAFSPSGDLWVGSGGTVVEFTKAQLAKSGSRSPRSASTPMIAASHLTPPATCGKAASTSSRTSGPRLSWPNRAPWPQGSLSPRPA
jgi:hypothetical protein